MSNALRPFQGISPRLGERVYIDPASVVIGDVELGDDCSVWPMTVIRVICIGSASALVLACRMAACCILPMPAISILMAFH